MWAEPLSLPVRNTIRDVLVLEVRAGVQGTEDLGVIQYLDNPAYKTAANSHPA